MTTTPGTPQTSTAPEVRLSSQAEADPNASERESGASEHPENPAHPVNPDSDERAG